MSESPGRVWDISSFGVGVPSRITIFIIILALVLGGAGYWYWQRNIYTKDILKLEILGPEFSEAGQEIEYVVKYKNNGSVVLEEPRLIFEFPPYSILAEGRPLRQEIKLDNIYPGEEKTVSFGGRLMGKENEIKSAKAQLSYRPKNLTARYESNTALGAQIKRVPLTFEFDLPSRVESGKEIAFKLNYFSNIDFPLSGLGIKIKYPSDFQFKESQPKAPGQDEWDLGALNKAEGGGVKISGILRGQVGEEKKFQAQLGLWQNGEFIILKEAERDVEIIRPSLYLRQEINGNPQYVASPGEWLHYEIFFKNVGDSQASNLFLVNKLDGDLFDFQTIKSDLGNYQAGDNSVIFDWKRAAKLQSLLPTQEGSVDFRIKLKDGGLAVKNPVLTNKIFISQVQEEFTNKVNSKLEIIQKGYFNDDIFGNSGPLPPKAGQTTTYTITWQAKNYYNDVKNVKVKAVLPIQVKLTGQIFPQDSKLTFNSISHEIVWDAGQLAAGAGAENPAPQVSFQVEFAPDSGQKGTSPDIIGQARITGEDLWTGAALAAQAGAINTLLPDDQTITPQKGIVQ